MAGYWVRACISFSAAHRIEGHPRCGRVHGHNYRVCVWLREEEPMDIDLDELWEWLRLNVYEVMDHQYLNQVLASRLGGGSGELPTVTSEDIARLVAAGLEERWPGRLLRVEVCETGDLCAGYEP
ncbi:MAG: hypothetical protein GXO15_04610 [Crenarchaeota archaeon]|nr:hypothetical protein [Thermoproteota archaeon]